MPFNTLKFFLIFPIIFVVYWCMPIRWQTTRKLFLLVVSYLLYLNFCPAHTLILLGITIVTYLGGRVLNSINERRKIVLYVFLAISLLPLAVFKYYNFINENIRSLIAYIGLDFSLPGLNWAIPIGISFFTFQALGYMLDVYYRKITVEKCFVDYLLFVSFFPQVASGPISKASELLPQIKNQPPFDYNQAVSGLRCLLWGIFLKVTLADRVGIYVDAVFKDYPYYSGIGCLIASLLYSIQIYADFAGYSFMAVGLGKLLGYDLVNNFKRPYFSVNITDFWHRWHISLSRLLKDYVYIPLGGSRCSKQRNYWNIFVTFLVSGIWHGASWHFIFWGVIHGCSLIIEKAFGWNKKICFGYTKLFRIIITFLIITFAWTIFRCPSISEAIGFFSRYTSLSGYLFAGRSVLVYSLIALLPVFAYEVLIEFYPKTYAVLFNKMWIRWFAYLTFFTMIMLIGVFDGSSFIYAGF